MPNVVIPDTSVLIVLEKIDALHLLYDVYGTVYTTREVIEEYQGSAPEWLRIVPVVNSPIQEKLEAQVDRGEASAMALYFDYDDATLILDDKKARRLAKAMNIRITGTLGVLSKAKIMGIIPKLKPLVLMLMRTDFRINRSIIDELLRIHDEKM